MTLKEIDELMMLNGWTRQQLAGKLGLCLNTVARWFISKPSQKRTPGVAECLVMRQWLNEARDAAMLRWKREGLAALSN